MDDITTDPSACASPDGASPPTLTPAAGAQTERPVRDIDDSPTHGAIDDREEQTARHISRDVRTYGWSYTAGQSW